MTVPRWKDKGVVSVWKKQRKQSDKGDNVEDPKANGEEMEKNENPIVKAARATRRPSEPMNLATPPAPSPSTPLPSPSYISQCSWVYLVITGFAVLAFPFAQIMLSLTRSEAWIDARYMAAPASYGALGTALFLQVKLDEKRRTTGAKRQQNASYRLSSPNSSSLSLRSSHMLHINITNNLPLITALLALPFSRFALLIAAQE
jgi:hypothetical protein